MSMKEDLASFLAEEAEVDDHGEDEEATDLSGESSTEEEEEEDASNASSSMDEDDSETAKAKGGLKRPVDDSSDEDDEDFEPPQKKKDAPKGEPAKSGPPRKRLGFKAPAAKKTPVKKEPPAKKTPDKKEPEKKEPPAKKEEYPIKKAMAKKAPVKKEPEKKEPEPETEKKKTPAKKTPPKKAPAPAAASAPASSPVPVVVQEIEKVEEPRGLRLHLISVDGTHAKVKGVGSGAFTCCVNAVKTILGTGDNMKRHAVQSARLIRCEGSSEDELYSFNVPVGRTVTLHNALLSMTSIVPAYGHAVPSSLV